MCKNIILINDIISTRNCVICCPWLIIAISETETLYYFTQTMISCQDERLKRSSSYGDETYSKGCILVCNKVFCYIRVF